MAHIRQNYVVYAAIVTALHEIINLKHLSPRVVLILQLLKFTLLTI